MLPTFFSTSPKLEAEFFDNDNNNIHVFFPFNLSDTLANLEKGTFYKVIGTLGYDDLGPGKKCIELISIGKLDSN